MKKAMMVSLNTEKLRQVYTLTKEVKILARAKRDQKYLENNGDTSDNEWRKLHQKFQDSSEQVNNIFHFVNSYIQTEELKISRGQWSFLHDGFLYFITRGNILRLECDDKDAPLFGMNHNTKKELIESVNSRIHFEHVQTILQNPIQKQS